MKPYRFAPWRARVAAFAAAVAVATLLPAVAAPAAGRDDAGDAGDAHLPYYVAMDPPIVYPGAVIRLQVRPPAGATGGSVSVAGRRYEGQVEDGMFVAYFAVDIDTLPGPYELRYDVGNRHGSRVVTVRARRMDEAGRGEKTLTREDLAVEELVRSNPRLVSLWNHVTTERYWNGPFLTPNPGPMAATFAMRRATETSLGSPHTGVDLAARGGSEVVSAGIGVVAVVASGPGAKLVVVDHGLGLYTYYFGLGEVFVDEGQRLRRGAILGAMPDSSRALLHFGARLGGAQVDPVSLPGITLKVPPPISGTVREPKEEKDKTSDYDY